MLSVSDQNLLNYNMPPKGRKNLRVKLDAVAAEDLRRKRKAREMVQEEAEETGTETESEEEADEEPTASQAEKKEEKKLRRVGSALEKCAVDKFGFSSLDGNKYLDDCAPQDFPDSFHFNEGVKQTELGNQFFSARYALLRGRSKKDGSLYSSPSVFLQKDWQGKFLTFTLPDRHVTPLRKFLEEVEREKQSTL